MANRRALTPEALDALRRRVIVGDPLTTIAAELQVAYKTVQNAVRELNLPVNASRARPVYNDEMRDRAIACYLDGQSTGEIARTLRVSDTWVQGQLRKRGIAARATGKLARLDHEVAGRYLAGESTGDLGRAYGVSDVAISVCLRRQGVTVREPGWATRVYPIREDAFDRLTPDAAYWAGFLLADGCVSAAGRITLVLKAADVEHVRAWLRFMGSDDRPISNDGARARAQVSSRRVAAALAAHGVVVGKTFTNVSTSSELARMPAFWRGMIDGDGTITLAKGTHGPNVGLVGSPAIMEQYAEFPDGRGA